MLLSAKQLSLEPGLSVHVGKGSEFWQWGWALPGACC